MPELPEVETIKRTLEPQIKGAAVTRVTVKRQEVVAHPAAEEFCRVVAGQTISGMIRRGKFLGIKMDSGDTVILHLRMTGCLLVTPPDFPEEKHTHVLFYLDNGRELRFSDTRRFGRFWLFRKGETDTYSGMGGLGLEPFDGGLTGEYLKKHFGRRKKAIKTCLLEQDVIAGIGNIYSDEILFEAQINPVRSANTLSEKEWECLAGMVPERLGYFIEKNAITAEEYLESRGQDYRNTPFLQVYAHDGKPCPHCGEMLCKTVISGRSSVYCPVCQAEAQRQG